MEKITLEALLRIRDLAACAVRHPDICAAAELALLELNWRSMMVFSLLFDMQSETYVPFVLWQKFQTALEDCTSEAQEELRREYSELMETENYGRQVEICNRLNQLREADRGETPVIMPEQARAYREAADALIAGAISKGCINAHRGN